MPRPKELFLSHSSANRRFARRLAGILRDHRVPVWHSESDIQTAMQWHDAIGQALDRCDWFALVLSPQAVQSKWVKHELLYVLQEDRFAQRIIPILYRDCKFKELSWVLTNFEYVNFRAGHEDGYRRLLATWGIRYKGR